MAERQPSFGQGYPEQSGLQVFLFCPRSTKTSVLCFPLSVSQVVRDADANDDDSDGDLNENDDCGGGGGGGSLFFPVHVVWFPCWRTLHVDSSSPWSQLLWLALGLTILFFLLLFSPLLLFSSSLFDFPVLLYLRVSLFFLFAVLLMSHSACSSVDPFFYFPTLHGNLHIALSVALLLNFLLYSFLCKLFRLLVVHICFPLLPAWSSCSPILLLSLSTFTCSPAISTHG